MKVTRRHFVSSVLAAPALAQQSESRLNVYFGDLHNHGNVGYAQGSLRRAFENARNHLDFFAYTPHAWWNDIGHYEGNVEHKWINGFAVTKARWPEVLKLVREFDAPGKFATLAGYEWHSTNSGDYHVIFPTLDAELYTPGEVKQLQAFAKRNGCIMIPHHPAVRQGRRGANIALRDPAVSPVLEMYSEWGNAEHDRAPFPYLRHTEPGRWTKNTLQYYLAQGHRLGVIASTDDHLGYPGGYGEGLAAVLAPSLTREEIHKALLDRRTYAVTGDRIVVDFRVNGRIMGRELPYARSRNLSVKVAGWDQIDRVEILKNNRVVHRNFPMDRTTTASSWGGTLLLRFEYGWGPWPALGITRVCDWDFHMAIDKGSIQAVQPCFTPGPLEEDRRDQILERTSSSLRVRSFTALRQQVEDRSQKAVVLKMNGGPDSKITITLKKPIEHSVTMTLRELAESSEVVYTGDFPKESGLLNRLVFQEHFETSFTYSDEGDGLQTDWYYVRVVQANGQLAWSSPIWVEKRA